jgi:8-oxo-dGTP pyrophosphatase MutT (NUDIX family)
MIDIDSALSDQLPHGAQLAYPPPEQGKKTSAVLVPLLKEEIVWKLLFTRRSEQLAEHGGQVSFPGGRAEAGDSGPLQTALREACEEIGLSAKDVRPLGILDPAGTRTGFRIWPVVCVLKWPMGLTLSLSEVREVFLVPVEWLMRPGNYHWRDVESANDGTPHRAPFFEPFQGQVIWGATAAITFGLMEILNGGRAA